MEAVPTSVQTTSIARSHVSLVGAGPGDPELLTLRAARRLREAEVVLHDSLISEEILGMVPRSAELINVGKRCGDTKDRGLQQREIHELLLHHSQRGCRVVRLKCGDPFVFGRGGEEVEFLAEYGIVPEVVPGITSALGASAACSLPLTHRTFGVTQVRFVVGQSKAKELPDMDWGQIARDARKQTTVFFMGFKSVDSICARLKQEGCPNDLPVAVVESATTPQERVFHSTVEDLPTLAKEHGDSVVGPVLMMLGPTAAFPAHIDKLMSGERPTKRARLGNAAES
mmetsp:Transcript_44740/g.96164  ORF Transcript_44740/g.96164 Transcript_44740/m.96164 type:complete len:285 (-) Transcript_44740:299-1153(-)